MQHRNTSGDFFFQLDKEDKQSAYYDGEIEYTDYRLSNPCLRTSRRKERTSLHTEKKRLYINDCREFEYYKQQHLQKCEQASLKLENKLVEFMQFT